jgi:hypothetical protein
MGNETTISKTALLDTSFIVFVSTYVFMWFGYSFYDWLYYLPVLHLILLIFNIGAFLIFWISILVSQFKSKHYGWFIFTLLPITGWITTPIYYFSKLRKSLKSN